MRRVVKFAAAAFAVLLLPVGLAAQGTGSVTGVVTDQASQRPVQDVQVSVTGTQRGALTDAQGRYTIAGVPAGAREVRARRVGYAPIGRTVAVPAGGSVTANFNVTQAVSQLQEVVVNAVTGQAQRRSEVGTNTGYIDVGALNKGPITKMADVLQGRVAGVNLATSAGTVGASQRIRIRGANSLSLSNEPLLYVDGVLISNDKGGFSLGGQDYSRLNDINSEEIENIEILKGPAASAIYGSAAANGVILLTTKKGRAGTTRWAAYVEGGSSRDKAPYQRNYAALTQFGTGNEPHYIIDGANNGILNTRQQFGSAAPYDICPNFRAAIPVGETINKQQRCSQDVLLNFDQFRDPLTSPYQDGARRKAGLNVSGGAEALTFYLSGDQEREDGVLRPNHLDKTSLRANLNAKLSNSATAGITTAYIKNFSNRISNDNSIFSPIINALLGPAEYLPGMESDTVRVPSDRLGSYFGYNTADQRKVNADQNVDRFILGANTNYTPASWLRLNANAGLDLFARTDAQTLDPSANLPLAQSYILGFTNKFRGVSQQYTSNASATGTFTPRENLTSNTTLGGSFNRNVFQGNSCYGIGIASGTTSCSATTSQFAVGEAFIEERTLGIFAREELNYADRMFIAASLRADNNSGLSRDISGLSYFPSVNASWIISKEGFFPQNGPVNQLRLRAAVGQAGTRPGFGAGDTKFASAVTRVGTNEVASLVLTNTGNPNLKVERTTEFEGGFDVGFFGDRVTAEYTAFQRRSRDALVAVPLPPSAGLTGFIFKNLGSVRNSGQELGLGVNILDRGNVKLNGHATATTLHNIIENLGAGVAPISLYRGEQQHREGYPTGGYFARPFTYNDANGDGKLSRNEVTLDTLSQIRDSLGRLTGLAYLGPTLPTNTQSISGDLTLFNALTITTLFERRGGNRQLDGTESFRCRQQANVAYYSQCSALSNPNASLDEQAAFLGNQLFGATPYGYIEDATFVKWRELSVRFNVPQSLASHSRLLEGAAISLSGRNLRTWTRYRGIDPEIAETGGASNFAQGEFNTQPPVRTLTIRFDFKP